MKYYIAAEGGGTKLLTVLYDEQLHIIRTARTSGTNDGYRKAEDIRASMEQLAEELLPDAVSVPEIQRLDMGLVGSSHVLLEVLSRHRPIRAHKHHGEGHVALAAAGVTAGLVAQSGTGSDAFLIQPDQSITVGGWGPLLGDEGSGYHIGLMALKAAIYAEDGRGPKTLLCDMVKETYKLQELWGLVHLTIHSVDVRHTVGSAAMLVAKAAKAGDEVAMRIYERAAQEMAHQVLTALQRAKGQWQGPIVTSGGGWKGHRHMFDTFSQKIKEVYPHADIRFPEFEPVVGCVLLRLLEEGMTETDAMAVLHPHFDILRATTPL